MKRILIVVFIILIIAYLRYDGGLIGANDRALFIKSFSLGDYIRSASFNLINFDFANNDDKAFGFLNAGIGVKSESLSDVIESEQINDSKSLIKLKLPAIKVARVLAQDIKEANNINFNEINIYEAINNERRLNGLAPYLENRYLADSAQNVLNSLSNFEKDILNKDLDLSDYTYFKNYEPAILGINIIKGSMADTKEIMVSSMATPESRNIILDKN